MFLALVALVASFGAAGRASAAGGPGPAESPAPSANPPAGSVIGPGTWTGTLTMKSANGGDNVVLDMNLHILQPGRGALVDLPGQSMYGFPLDDVSWTTGRIVFVMDVMGTGSEFRFKGLLVRVGGVKILGTISGSTWNGSFMLSPRLRAQPEGETRLEVDTGRGALPGTLTMPSGLSTTWPLVLLLPGSGPADRDGNNYNVPGRNDALAMLARALADRGVATYRYDKRGSGEAYMLAKESWPGIDAEMMARKAAGQAGIAEPVLSDHVGDAQAVIKRLARFPWVSRLVVAGVSEGGWVGAAAANRCAAEGIAVDGLVLLSPSGLSPLESLRESLADAPGDARGEAERIIAAILKGKDYPAPSEYLADFFDPLRRAWLTSWLAFNPKAEVAAVQAPVLLVRGESDMQVGLREFGMLLDSRPDASAWIVPGMNYALKEVGSDEERNYASFNDPSYPLPDALVELLAAFAAARPARTGAVRYDRARGGSR